MNNIWIDQLHSGNSHIKREIICIVPSEMETNKLLLWAKSYQYSKLFIEAPNEHRILIAINIEILKQHNLRIPIFLPCKIGLSTHITFLQNF